MRRAYRVGGNREALACPETWAGSAARAFAPETVTDHFEGPPPMSGYFEHVAAAGER